MSVTFSFYTPFLRHLLRQLTGPDIYAVGLVGNFEQRLQAIRGAAVVERKDEILRIGYFQPRNYVGRRTFQPDFIGRLECQQHGAVEDGNRAVVVGHRLDAETEIETDFDAVAVAPLALKGEKGTGSTRTCSLTIDENGCLLAPGRNEQAENQLG